MLNVTNEDFEITLIIVNQRIINIYLFGKRN